MKKYIALILAITLLAGCSTKVAGVATTQAIVQNNIEEQNAEPETKTATQVAKIEEFAIANEATSRALHKIAEVGGPRCCKRDSYLSILSTIDFVKEKLNIEIEKTEVKCNFKSKNNQCIGKRCPFA